MGTTTGLKHIDHLGLVAAVCDEAGLVNLINEYVEKDRRKVSVGDAVKAMILNALGFAARACSLHQSAGRQNNKSLSSNAPV